MAWFLSFFVLKQSSPSDVSRTTKWSNTFRRLGVWSEKPLRPVYNCRWGFPIRSKPSLTNGFWLQIQPGSFGLWHFRKLCCGRFWIASPGLLLPSSEGTPPSAPPALVARAAQPPLQVRSSLPAGQVEARAPEDWEDGELAAKGKQVSPNSLRGSRRDGSGQQGRKEKKRFAGWEKAAR